MNLAVLNFHVSPMSPTKFQLNLTHRSRADVVSKLSSWPPWGQSNHLNGTNLAILNLHVTPLPSTTFGLNLLNVREQKGLKSFKMATMGPFCISERNDFSNSESLCYSDASHQVSAQSILQFERRCCLKIFKMAEMAAILDVGTGQF